MLKLPPATSTPCVECPWRRVSGRGWLGPFTAQEWIDIVQGDEGIACHRTVKHEGKWEGALQCRGAAIFRENIFKSPRNSEVITGPVNRELVFGSSREFLEHHEIMKGHRGT